ncbi:hypothetical protein [Aureimonas psammosilenae]|uniref:hypothetical protein n=1 Tax=Aureimonas psammosilenae TaxID=2495496 RepID=UPI001260D3F1|nr:hypothetical protein [Aureimonas psammosilenae]
MSRRVGIIHKPSGYFYGTALLSGDIPATIQAAASEWDGGSYVYTDEGDEFEAYILPEDWNDEAHPDGQNQDTIEAVKAGAYAGECGTIDRQDDFQYRDEVRKTDLLRRSIEVEDGHRVDIEVDSDIEFMDEGGDRLTTITVRIAGTWFDGIKTLRASEWIDEDGDFEEAASHFACNDVRDWRRAVPGPEFEEEAWSAIKAAILEAGIPLIEEEEDHDQDDEDEDAA